MTRRATRRIPARPVTSPVWSPAAPRGEYRCAPSQVPARPDRSPATTRVPSRVESRRVPESGREASPDARRVPSPTASRVHCRRVAGRDLPRGEVLTWVTSRRATRRMPTSPVTSLESGQIPEFQHASRVGVSSCAASRSPDVGESGVPLRPESSAGASTPMCPLSRVSVCPESRFVPVCSESHFVPVCSESRSHALGVSLD